MVYAEIVTYKLEIFSDGYCSSKFIPHEIFFKRNLSERKRVITVLEKMCIKSSVNFTMNRLLWGLEYTFLNITLTVFISHSLY